MNPYVYSLIWTDDNGGFYTLYTADNKILLMNQHEAEESADEGISREYQIADMVPDKRYWIDVKDLKRFFGVVA